MIPEVAGHIEEIRALCERAGVKRLDLFGSAATGTARPDSDLDFLVEFEASHPGAGRADRYFDLLESLEALLGRSVDLVVATAITNPYFRQSVEQTRALLYAA